MYFDFVQEIFPFVKDLVHTRKRYLVFLEELEGVLNRMYPEKHPQQVFWGTQVCLLINQRTL